MADISLVKNTSAILVAIFALLGFVAESQLTQYVQTDLRYRQPFFTFYLVHSAFTIIFPLHLLYLVMTTDRTLLNLLMSLKVALTSHLNPTTSHRQFPTQKLIILIICMTIGVTLPGLLWFFAVSLAPLTDVTAIWNANAFWAYIFSVKMLKQSWDKRRLTAVSAATIGVFAVVYGGAITHDSHKIATSTTMAGSAPLIGDIMTLVASLGYGLYQVLYKKFATLDLEEHPRTASYQRVYSQIEDAIRDASDVPPSEDDSAKQSDSLSPPPFGLFANFLTAAIGVCTLCVLWIFVPVLDWLGVETFHAPPDFTTVFAISGIALSGVVFNAGFMVLLSVWGPIVTSVGSLLTIVLVFLSDAIFGGAMETVTVWSLGGCGMIIAAFCVLALDMARSSGT